MKWRSVLGFIAILAIGCDEQESTSSIVSKTQLFSDETAVTDDADMADIDIVDMPLSIKWVDFDPSVESTQSTIGLTVENNRGIQVEVVSEALCSGLIRHNAVQEFGRINLGPHEKDTVSIAASDLPLQSALGISIVSFQFTVANKETGKVVIQVTPPLYYRHDTSFNEVNLFGESELMSKYDGKLLKLASTADSSQIIGRIKNAEEGFQDVILGDSSFVDIKDEKVVGWETGMDVEIDTSSSAASEEVAE